MPHPTTRTHPPVYDRAPVAALVLVGPAVAALAAGDGPLTGFTEPARIDVVVTGAAAATGPRGVVPDPATMVLAARYGVDLQAWLRAETFTGRAGDSVRVPVPPVPGLPSRFHLIGTGTGTPGDLRRAAATAGRLARGRAGLVTSLAAGADREDVRAVVEGLLLGGYSQPSTGLRPRPDSAPVDRVVLLGPVPPGAVEAGLAHARATLTVRDLANTPSDLKTPAWLADRAVALARAAGLQADVLAQDELLAGGFGGLLAVGSGSRTGPRLVRLEYRPAARAVGGGDRVGGPTAARRPVVLVGKGITFDTGGLSIKPREAMLPMKTDMAGAAAVLAALVGCAALGIRRPVVGLLPLAENAVGAASYRPGDVVRHYGGRTSEVVNTDAEGRLVLADALAYADAMLDPEVIVDIATLTGAAAQGLGRRWAALYATDHRLAAGLEVAAAASGEAVWRMPLIEDYRSALDSTVADLRHTAAGAIGGGSITAALFLREFTGGRRWAHLDIAGPARSDKEVHELTKGATGFGARLLLRWLEGLR